MNRWSISQYEELINNLSTSRRSASLFWDSYCREEFLTILQRHQEQFYSFWKELTPEMIRWFMDDLGRQFLEQFESTSLDIKNSLGITLKEFQKEIDLWRRESGVEMQYRSWQK